MHILGLFVDWKAPYLTDRLERLQQARRERNPQIAKRLQNEGLSITYDEVVEASGGGQVGRPHFARVLVQKGYVATMEEAFDRYLKKGAPGYVEKFRYGPQEAIDMIHRAGGAAVLAHPFTLGFSDEKREEEKIRELTGCGLDGLEVYYSSNSPGDTLRYLRLCDAVGLLPTGGSDFHGAHKPGVELGVGRGDLRVSYSLLGPLLEAARGHRRLEPSG
jgi:predicted metal-dependent phosphoesterase TrpH